MSWSEGRAPGAGGSEAASTKEPDQEWELDAGTHGSFVNY